MTKSQPSKISSPRSRSPYWPKELGLDLLFILKASLYLFMLPYALLRLDGLLSPHLPVLALAWPWRACGILLAAVGGYLALRAFMILSFIGKEWPRRRPVLLVTGYIYAFTRHPFYLGYGMIWIGAGICRSSVGLALLGTALLALLLFYAALVEEPRLVREYGEAYQAYRQEVGRIWPHWRALAHGALGLNLPLLIVLILLRLLFRLIWQVKVEGQEHVPQTGAGIMLANHCNLADPFLLGVFLVRPIHFLASDELFRRSWLRLLFALCFGALSKRRWSRDISALRQAQRWLARDEVVGIFPEGSRNWDGAPVQVGDEAYKFIHHCRVPIYTAAIIGGHEAMPRWAGWPSFARVTVRFYPPILPGECAHYSQTRARIEANIFAGQKEPPVERTLWASHKGITTVAWACLNCGTAGMAETKTGIHCGHCGAAWRVTRRLELVEEGSGRLLREYEYHHFLQEMLASGGIKDGGRIAARVKAFLVDQRRLTLLGEGDLSLTGLDTLVFANERQKLSCRMAEVSFAYLNLPGHLVVTDRWHTLEYVFQQDSPVRWEDYLADARRAISPSRQGSRIKDDVLAAKI